MLVRGDTRKLTPGKRLWKTILAPLHPRDVPAVSETRRLLSPAAAIRQAVTRNTGDPFIEWESRHRMTDHCRVTVDIWICRYVDISISMTDEGLQPAVSPKSDYHRRFQDTTMKHCCAQHTSLLTGAPQPLVVWSIFISKKGQCCWPLVWFGFFCGQCGQQESCNRFAKCSTNLLSLMPEFLP